MNPRRCPSLLVLALVVLGGCATRPINPPIAEVDLHQGYRFVTRGEHRPEMDAQNLVVLAFSGGGTRAAAFSYGVLEALRDMEVIGPKGGKIRLLDEVDIVTGVSGGSFTALAYGLYGDKLFDLYETSFLKRDVQGELIARFFSPGNWGALWSEGWGRSEMAAQLYDEILFHGATFADLDRGAADLSAARFRLSVLGSRRGAALPRRRGFVGGAVRAVAGHFQQLRGQLQVRHRALGRSIRRSGHGAQAGGTRDQASAGNAGLSGWRAQAVRPSRRRRSGGQPRHARRARGAGGARGAEHHGPADAARSRAQDHRLRRQFVVVAEDRLGRIGAPAERRGDPDQGDRGADRPLFLRGSGAAAGYDGALADHAPHTRFGRLCR